MTKRKAPGTKLDGRPTTYTPEVAGIICRRLGRDMSRLAVLVGLLCAVAVSAQAETWKARNQNLPGIVACSGYQDGYVYTFESAGGSLTSWGPNGKAFTAPIDALGQVKYEFRSPNGGRFEITGSVPNHDLTVKNLNSGCASRMVPM